MRFILLLFFCINSTWAFSQGKLDSSKDELKQGSPQRKPNRNSYDNSGSSIAEDLIVQAIAKGIVYGIQYGFIGEYKSERDLSNRLTRYPFEHRSAGNYIDPDSVTKPKYFRIDIENQFIYNSDNLFGDHLKINIRPFHYFYFQSNIFLLNEIDDFNNKRSSLNLFNLDFCYDRIRIERFNLGFTIGANYIGNDVQQAGVAFGLCAEVFLLQAFSVYSCGKLSGINGLPVNQFEVKGRYHHKKLFLSVGYEYLKIATPSYHFLSVGGGLYF
ncbi:MAG: hypothetical protein JWM14_534 [Chitinophagaceae bacterium]|nr:hypothetical protein [Chitinophagaceae bacterium]